MEYVLGENIEKFLKDTKLYEVGFSEEVAKAIVKQVLQGMRFECSRAVRVFLLYF